MIYGIRNIYMFFQKPEKVKKHPGVRLLLFWFMILLPLIPVYNHNFVKGSDLDNIINYIVVICFAVRISISLVPKGISNDFSESLFGILIVDMILMVYSWMFIINISTVQWIILLHLVYFGYMWYYLEKNERNKKNKC